MGTLLSDLRYGLRGLVRRPGFTLAAVLALSLGLGANTAIFSVVDAVVLSPLPYPDPDRLVMIWETSPQEGLDHERVTPLNFLDYKTLNAFEDAAAWWHPEINLTDPQGDPLRVTTIEASSNFFSVLGVAPQLGAGFVSADSRLHGEEPEVVISDRLWQSRYGGDRDIVGRTVHLDGEPHTVVGVMPPGFHFPGETDVWQRLAWDLARHSRHPHFMEAAARLRPGVDPEQAGRDLAALSARLQQEHPASNKGWGARLVSLQTEIVGDFRPRLLLLLAAVGLLLLMACANVAHLLLARASAREREVAIRSALGANRRRLLRQFLTESFLLGVIGAAAGIGLAWLVLELLVALRPIDIPRLAEVSLDGRVLGFSLGIALLTVILFGLVPAVQMSSVDLQGTLKEGGRGSGSGPAARRLRGALVVLEVAAAVVLLVGAGLLLRSFLLLLRQEPGFRASQAVTVNVQLPPTLYNDWDQVSRFYTDLVANLNGHPGIESAGATGFLPLEPGRRIGYTLPDQPPVTEGEEPTAQYITVSPGYFETLGIPLVAGRTFDGRDTRESPSAVVVNQALARRAWPDGRVLGRTITAATSGMGPLGRSLKESRDWDVVGVVGDVRNNTLVNDAEPTLYFVQTQFPYRSMHLVARGRGEVSQVAAAVRAEVRKMDPGLALSEVRTLGQVVSASTAQPRFVLVLMASFAALALIVAAVGIYGILSYAVDQRRSEIGVRLALGATPGHVTSIVVRQGLALTAAGLMLGLFGAFLLARLMAGLLFGIRTSDAATFTAVPAVVLLVALVAAWLPARRAAGVDPVEALRAE